MTVSKYIARRVVCIALLFMAVIWVLIWRASWDSPQPAAVVPFLELAPESGLDFVHFNGMSGDFYMPEVVGGGVAMFDYDNDGDLDIYIRQGRMLTSENVTSVRSKPKSLSDRLFRNDLTSDAEGNPIVGFTDVTAAAGIVVEDYGMGVACGDVDNDGRIDLYLTNLGPNRLLMNMGDGTFRDATAAAGVDDARWSTSATFFDYDLDGNLDLFVCNYVQFSFALHHPCSTPSGQADYCGPNNYTPEPDSLFRNLGDGAFENVSVKTGVAAKSGPGLGVVCSDLNGDGYADIYVANDGKPNHFWLNQEGRSFNENGRLAGCAFNGAGKPEAGMGVTVADFDVDGDNDMFVTHLNGETNTLYVNDGDGLFRDAGAQFGLAFPSRKYTGFGTGWLDYDNDGLLDLVVANGEVRTIEALARQGDPYPLHQPNQLFRRIGPRGFEELDAGPAFSRSEVSRGLALGDVDNDGDTDVLILNNSGRVRLLINQVGNRNAWMRFRLVGPDGKRDAIGTRLAILRNGVPAQTRHVSTDGSYCSAHDPRVLIGLGANPRYDAVEVVWPNGKREVWTDLDVNREHVLRYGSGNDD